MLPPSGRSASGAPASVRGAACAQRASRWIQNTAASIRAQDTSNRFIGPSGTASVAVTSGPAIAPALPPAAMQPNSRRAWALV